jgi:hypothetical protein
MTGPSRMFFDALSQAEQEAAISRLAAPAQGEHTTAHATGLGVEQIRRVLSRLARATLRSEGPGCGMVQMLRADLQQRNHVALLLAKPQPFEHQRMFEKPFHIILWRYASIHSALVNAERRPRRDSYYRIRPRCNAP